MLQKTTWSPVDWHQGHKGINRCAKRSGALLAAVLAGALAGGCGMSSLTSGLGGGMFGSSSSKTEVAVSEEQLLSAAKANDGATGSTGVGEVAAGCPRVTVAPRGNYVTIYEPGRTGDGLAIMHRGEITKTARECEIQPGFVTVKFGFSGKVLLGPKGVPGNVTLPVNVTVTDAKRAQITKEALSIDAAVAVDKPVGYFSTVRTVSFPIPEGTRPGEFELLVSFDNAAPGAG